VTTERSDNHPARRAKRWRRLGVLMALVALAVVAFAFLATGKPGEALLSFGLGRGLGAAVSLRDIGVIGRVRVAETRVRDADARADDTDTFAIEDLDLDYDMPPVDGRFFRSLDIRRFSAFLDHSDPENTNYDFLLRLLSQPGSTDPRPFLPRAVNLRDIAVGLRGVAMALSFRGIALDARIDDLDDLEATLMGLSASATWWVRDPSTERAIEDAVLDVRVRRAGDVFHAEPVRIAVPGLLDVAAMADCRLGESTDVDVRLDTCRFETFDLSEMAWADTPVSLSFEAADASQSRVKGRFSQGATQIDDLMLRLALTGARIALGDDPIYTGDAEVEAMGQDTRVEFAASLNRGQRVQGGVEGAPEAGKAWLSVEKWAREDVLALVPEPWRDYQRHVPTLRQVSLEGHATWHENVRDLTVQARPALEAAGQGAEVMDIAATATQADGTISGEGTLRLGEQRIDVSGAFTDADHLSAKANFTALEPARLVRTLLDTAALEDLRARLDGAFSVEAGAESKTYAVKVEVNGTGFGYGGFALPEDTTVGIRGTGLLDLRDGARVSGDPVTIHAGEGVTLGIEDWRAALDFSTAEGVITGDAELERLGAWLSLPDGWGQAQMRAEVRKEAQGIGLDLEVRADPLGYGGLSMPYGTETVVSVVGRYDTGAKAIHFHTFALSTEGSSVRVEPWVLSLDPLAAEATVTVESDLALLVPMGYCDDVAGSLTGSGRAAYGEAGPAVEFTGQLDAARLALAGALAALSGVSATVEAAYAGDASGHVEFHVEDIIAAGAPVRGVHGTATLRDGTLGARGLKGEVFDGQFRANVKVGLFDASLPVEFAARVLDLDLATLTREMKPGEVALTGLASGDVILALDRDGLKDLRVRVESTQDFSVDRKTVLDILLTNYTGGVTGGKQLSRAVEQVVGEAAQRPFQRATLNLDLEEGRLTGQAMLASDDLSLTVDLHVDPGALYEALTLRQEMQLDNVAGIDAQSEPSRE